MGPLNRIVKSLSQKKKRKKKGPSAFKNLRKLYMTDDLLFLEMLLLCWNQHCAQELFTRVSEHVIPDKIMRLQGYAI